MADNVTLPAQGTGSSTPVVAADEVAYSGDTAVVQLMRLVHVSGAEGSKTMSEIVSDEGLLTREQGAGTASGTLSGLGQTVEISTLNAALIGIHVGASNLVGSLVIGATIDGTNWTDLAAWNDTDGGPALSVLSVNAHKFYVASTRGATRVRVRVGAYTSGSATITLASHASAAADPLVGMHDSASPGADGLNNSAVAGTYDPYGTSIYPLRSNLVFNGTTWDRQRGDTNGSYVGGATAHDAVDAGNPVKIGFKAASALPTAVANADRANGVADLWGRQLTSHIDPAMQAHKYVNVTTTQTGSDVWTPASGKKIAITSIVIAAYGTTAGRVILWFGDNADTTFTAGTDQVAAAASFAPSSTSKPGLVYTPAVPIFCTTADRELHLTTDAGISLDITVEGYEW